jgi:PD-(D/E)XK nuclease superfamily
LSFSRFVRLRRCLLSGAGLSALRGVGRPRPPAGRPQVVGEVLHEVMQTLNEAMAEGGMSGPELRAEFNRVVGRKGAQIAASRTTAHLGDPGMWPEVTRLYRGLAEMRARRTVDGANGGGATFAEIELWTNDRLLFGRPDACFVREDGIEVVDYKSGVLSRGDVPNEVHVEQLYFYAHFVEENYSRYPRILSLAGGDGGIVSVTPNRERSAQVASDMRAMLARYNAAVAAAAASEDLAQPSTESCAFCDMKPACKAFWAALPKIEVTGRNRVAVGRQVTPLVASHLGGGSFVMAVERSSLRADRLRVSRVFGGRYPDVDLQCNVGQQLVVTGLRQANERNAALAETTERTTIVAVTGAT